MRASSFSYLSKQGVKSLWSNRMMTLASVGVLTACLLIVGFAVLLTENINNMVKFVEQQNEFKAFVYTEKAYNEMQTQKNEETIVPSYETKPGEENQWLAVLEKIEQEIKKIDNVSSVELVTKEEGIEEMKKQLGPEQASLLDDYKGEDNPLNDSFTVTVDDLSLLDKTISEVEKVDGIEIVTAANEAASTLTSIRNIINIVGWAIIAALVIVSLVIITNTIRASIFTRRKELNIMKYVGATNSFIRLPFIIEGICLGLLSALIAFAVIWVGYEAVLNTFVDKVSSQWLQEAFRSIIPFSDVALQLSGFFAISSIVIGVLGSVVSIRNHIKV